MQKPTWPEDPPDQDGMCADGAGITARKFPEDVATTSLRPDVVLTSATSKQATLLELTVPWEDRM